jgi:aminodeoxychorismate lyase
MIAFLNGRLLPEEQAVVSVLDRSFLYGDGLFETLLIHRGVPFRWSAHFERLEQGAELLNISLPFTAAQLRDFMDQLVRANEMPEALLRMTLSRGIGPRGYSPRGANQPVLAMTLHPAPPQTASPPLWRVITSSVRLPAGETLALFKTCNKLPQVLARAEAEAAGADEALLLNTRGEVVEASAANLFWITDTAICTSPPAAGILPGVTRNVVLELCRPMGLATQEVTATPADLRHAQGMFLSLSSFGVVEVVTLDQQPVRSSPLTQSLQRAYSDLLKSECG